MKITEQKVFALSKKIHAEQNVFASSQTSKLSKTFALSKTSKLFKIVCARTKMTKKQKRIPIQPKRKKWHDFAGTLSTFTDTTRHLLFCSSVAARPEKPCAVLRLQRGSATVTYPGGEVKPSSLYSYMCT